MIQLMPFALMICNRCCKMSRARGHSFYKNITNMPKNPTFWLDFSCFSSRSRLHCWSELYVCVCLAIAPMNFRCIFTGWQVDIPNANWHFQVPTCTWIGHFLHYWPRSMQFTWFVLQVRIPFWRRKIHLSQIQSESYWTTWSQWHTCLTSKIT